MFKEKTKQNKTIQKKEKRKSPPGKLNNRVLPRRRNLEPIGAVGTNLWPFSFGESVGLLRLSSQP